MDMPRHRTRATLVIGIAMLILVGSVNTAATGGPDPSEFPISGPGAGSTDGSPDVAFNTTAGEYYVVWVSGRTGDSQVWGRRVSAAGVPVGPPRQISTSGDSPQGPVIAYNSWNDEYLVVWTNDPGTDSDLRGRRVRGSTGRRIGTDDLCIDCTDTDPVTVDMSFNTQVGRYLVVWDQGGPGDIYGWRVGRWGTVLDPAPIGIATDATGATGINYTPRVAFNSDLGTTWQVVWQDHRNGATDIYAQRVTASGNLRGGNFCVACTDAPEEWPAIAFNIERNNYMVAFTVHRPDGSHPLMVQPTRGFGGVLGSPRRIHSFGNPFAAEIVANHVYVGLLVVWQRRPMTADIRAQYINAMGTRECGACWFYVEDHPAQQIGHAIVNNTITGEYLVVWQDARRSSDDIFGAVVPPWRPVWGGGPADDS
jgi:hypothetical protein